MLSSYINESEECVPGAVGFWTGRWDTETEACQSISGSIRIFAEYGSIKDNYDNNKPIFWKGVTGEGPCECAPTGFYQPNHGGYGYTGTIYYWLGAPYCAWEGTETCASSYQINIRYSTIASDVCSGTGNTKSVWIDAPSLEDATGMWDDAARTLGTSLGTKNTYVRLQDSGAFRSYSVSDKTLGQPTLCGPVATPDVIFRDVYSNDVHETIYMAVGGEGYTYMDVAVPWYITFNSQPFIENNDYYNGDASDEEELIIKHTGARDFSGFMQVYSQATDQLIGELYIEAASRLMD